MHTESRDLEEEALLQPEHQEGTPEIIRYPGPDIYTRALEEFVRHMPMISIVRPAERGRPAKVVSSKVSALGYSPEDFTSGKLAYEDIIDPGELPGVMLELLENSREGAYGLTQRYMAKKKNGELVPVEEQTLIQRDEKGEPAYYATILKLLD